jgi:tetratricopeptide (TPR) repeat protein
MPRDDSVDSFLRAAVEITEPTSVAAIGPLPGDVLAGRFLVERWVGRGGMGAIHRAVDLQTREPVAVKVLAFAGHGDAQRFAREAAVLAELSHPAIVRYVAHGRASNAPFLAMEWLEGEDLADRLLRAPLTVSESLTLLRRACQALALAHARGIVHRDLKPSNLFLVDRDPARTKLLDFGIARHTSAARTLTQSGAVIGTVGYMSPEQAIASHRVDARTDMFALGCVLFECLTGRAAFSGPNAVAVLAKVLHEEPPAVSELRAGVDPALVALVSRLLAKNPEARPKDASALLPLWDALGHVTQPVAPIELSRGVTAAEQKIVSVILAAPAAKAETSASTRARPALREFGVEPVQLRDGGLLVVIGDSRAATDQASHAARCALSLRRARPELGIAVATGSAETQGRVPVGVAIDRAAELLAFAVAGEPLMLIDELTAALLEPSFDVRREAARSVLVGEQLDRDATRLLLGRPTPFVGRDKELGLLELTLRECVADRVLRAVLVTGPPGQGKSRLRHEFVKRVRAGGVVHVLAARADQVGAGSAFALAAQLVRAALGSGGPERLRAHLDAICSPVEAARLADFLGELIGAPALEPGPELLAARTDPRSMVAWLRRSFGEWLGAEVAARPVLLVLEDLHWADLPSVMYLGEALTNSSTRPLMALALARPEVHDAFPHLWASAETLELALNRLTPRAAEQLVREVLGPDVPEASVAGIVERAAGNAFYLEELIRRFAQSGDGTLPETVLALVQSRLERLDAEPRRFARAASIFGEAFRPSGVARLLRSDATPHDIDVCLRALLSAEVIALATGTRVAGEREYRFRHAFLREAAYAMLTADDKRAGHHLAGEWLERIGEPNALSLAQHFELGGDSARAASWLVRATHAALDAGNLAGTIALGDRAIAHGVPQGERGVLRRLQAIAQMMRGDLASAVAVGREALALLPTSSPDWLRCASNLYTAGALLGDESVIGPVLQAIASAPVTAESAATYGWAASNACTGLIAVGELDFAEQLLARAEANHASAAVDAASRVALRHFGDTAFLASVAISRTHCLLMRGALGSACRRVRQARALADAAMYESARATSRVLQVVAHSETGRLDLAEAEARELLQSCEPAGMHLYSNRCAAALAAAKLNAGHLDEATALLRPLLERADRLLASGARARLAHALIASGALDAARSEAERALEQAERFPAVQAPALAALARLALQAGAPLAALASSERGMLAAARASWPSDGTILRVAHAEALLALGRAAEARAAIRAARERVLQIAASLEDAALAETFLADVVANARTLQLAEAWLEEPP